VDAEKMVGLFAVWARALAGRTSSALRRSARRQAYDMRRWVEGQLLTTITDESVRARVTASVTLTGTLGERRHIAPPVAVILTERDDGPSRRTR
jgi:hypothetical protein